jgi:hypothetical protein
MAIRSGAKPSTSYRHCAATQNLDQAVEKRGLHGEAVSSPRSSGVRRQLDSRRLQGGVLQLHGKLTSVKQ